MKQKAIRMQHEFELATIYDCSEDEHPCMTLIACKYCGATEEKARCISLSQYNLRQKALRLQKYEIPKNMEAVTA